MQRSKRLETGRFYICSRGWIRWVLMSIGIIRKSKLIYSICGTQKTGELGRTYSNFFLFFKYLAALMKRLLTSRQIYFNFYVLDNYSRHAGMSAMALVEVWLRDCLVLLAAYWIKEHMSRRRALFPKWHLMSQKIDKFT